MNKAVVPFKEFMSAAYKAKGLGIVSEYGQVERPESIQDIPLTALFRHLRLVN